MTYGSLRSAGIFLFVLMTLSAFASVNAQASPLVNMVKQKYGNMTAASAKFSLDIFWSVREKTESMKGTIAFAPDGKFRIELPSAIYVSDGKKLWQYNRSAKQVIIERADAIDRNSFPSAIIAGCFAYSFSEKAQSDGISELVADMTEKNSTYSGISIFVDSKTATLKKIVTTDRSGNTSTYLLKSFAVGSKAKLPSFTFEIPKGTDVIDKTE